MRLATLGMLATEYAHRYGCTHDEAVTEIAATHRLAEIPEMPVLVFEDGGVLALGDHSDPARHARHSELLDLGRSFQSHYARLLARSRDRTEATNADAL